MTTPAYLDFEYAKPSFPVDQIGFTHEERTTYARAAIQFVREPQPIDFLARQTNGAQPLYNQRELDHMVDVQNVFQSTWKGGWIAVLFLLGSSIWLLSSAGSRRLFARSIEIAGLGTAVGLFGIGFLAVIGWDTWFTLFHKLFFVPGSWTFSPEDTLIRLFPVKFWFDSALTVAALALAGGLVIALAGSWLRRKIFVEKPQKQHGKTATNQSVQKPKKQEWPLSVYGWMMGLGLAGYLIGMAFFGDDSHPFHWMAGLLGLLLGGVVGWALHRWKSSTSRRYGTKGR
ncbi:TIGR01906 family membrane protein [bacterium]|nr:MAG: TIGR01906 family membrane protein [bacterium]